MRKQLNADKPVFNGHVIDGLLSLASPDLTSRDVVPTLAATLTTIALNDGSLRWFETCT
jgi:hypothetical protein